MNRNNLSNVIHINNDLVICRQVKISDMISRRFGNFMMPLSLPVVTFDLAFVNFILICNLENGVMKSPKHREIISLIFTCQCDSCWLKDFLTATSQLTNYDGPKN